MSDKEWFSLEAQYWLILMRKCLPGEEFFTREYAKRRDAALMKAAFGAKTIQIATIRPISSIRPFGSTMSPAEIQQFRDQNPVQPKRRPRASMYWDLNVRPIIDI